MPPMRPAGCDDDGAALPPPALSLAAKFVGFFPRDSVSMSFHGNGSVGSGGGSSLGFAGEAFLPPRCPSSCCCSLASCREAQLDCSPFLEISDHPSPFWNQRLGEAPLLFFTLLLLMR